MPSWPPPAAPPACRCTTTPAWPSASAARWPPAISRSRPGAPSRRCCRPLRSSADASARIDALKLPEDETLALAALRRFRHAEALRLVFRDVNRLDDLPETLSATSVLYEVLLEVALGWSERALAARYGQPRSREGERQRLVVVGFGKLGGAELNFSSDIDLVLAYPHGGESDGARSLDNGEYFVRL